MAENHLGDDRRPRFFGVDPRSVGWLGRPTDRYGLSLRTAVRSLDGMQKEAVVLNAATGSVWRLVSDEGPYLDGYDEAPCPLSFLTTGMVSAYADAVAGALVRSGAGVEGLRLTLDNRYTMRGSARAGTMTGGALEPSLRVEVDGDPETVAALAAEAVHDSPLTGLMQGVHASVFTLSVNGGEVPVGRVNAMDSPALADLSGQFDGLEPVSRSNDDDLIVREVPAEQVSDVPGGAGSSFAESQERTLHVRGVCSFGEDGVKTIHQNLFRPIGSQFRFLSSESAETGEPQAPDAATYISAGIAFCFMTQFGRYAQIVRRPLDAYSVVQDTHFTPPTPGKPSVADPVETHVHIETSEDEDYARRVLDMSEQTCFLHAFCRTDLGLALDVVALSTPE